MPLSVIACSFKTEQHGPVHHGLAVCSDPDTPVTFIYPDGKPFLGEIIWNFKLQHYMPWATFDWEQRGR